MESAARWLRSRVIKRRQGLYILSIIFLVLYSVAAGYQGKYDGRPTQLGVSYSTKYARELGIDWQRGFLALLDEVNVKHFRLMSYWDTIETEKDTYDWSELDWQLQQAEAHGADVTLSIGRRQPRWPECHTPEWAAVLPEDVQRDEIKQFLGDLTSRYKDSKVILSYQIDNEAANNVFGTCPDYDANFLSEEIALVRRIDPSKQIITNVSNQSGLPMNGPVEQADAVGLSVYKRAHFEALNRTWFWSFWYVPSEWHSLRAALIEGLDDKPAFIHELQTEPWGADDTTKLSVEEQNETMDPQKLRETVYFAEQIGTDKIYLWGGEWWYWRHTETSDKEMWNTVIDVFKQNAADNT